MSFSFNTQKNEYNGGSLSIWRIPDAQLVANAYVGPTAYTDYTELGSTDGITIETSVSSTDVSNDQTNSVIDSFDSSKTVTITATMQETDALRMAYFLGLDTTVSTDYATGLTEISVHEAGSLSGVSRAYFGGQTKNTYYDVLFEKVRSHTDKMIGFRIPKGRFEGNISPAYKNGETAFFDVTIKGYAVDFTKSGGVKTDFDGKSVYFFEEV